MQKICKNEFDSTMLLFPSRHRSHKVNKSKDMFEIKERKIKNDYDS